MTEQEKTTTAAGWDGMAEILRQQAEAYGQFYEFLDSKEKTIVGGDMKKIADLLQKENELVSGLENLEDRRLEIAAELHPGGKGATLKDLLECAPEEHSRKLEELALRLMDALNKVAIKNKTNSELIASAMEFTNYMLNLMSSSSMPEESTYAYNGRIRQADVKIKSILNKQV